MKHTVLSDALKAIRDSEENDLGQYAKFCQNTASEALRNNPLDDTWICKGCGIFHSNQVCTHCGTSRS